MNVRDKRSDLPILPIAFFLLVFTILPLSGVPASASKDAELSAATGPKVALSPDERRWLSEHKVLRVAGPKAFPPFHFFDEHGKAVGMAQDYARFVMRQLGVEMEIEGELPWPEVLKRTAERRIDVIACAAHSPDRDTFLLFSDAYLSFPLVILGRRDGPFIGGVKDLRGRRVVFVNQTSAHEWLKVDSIDVTPLYVDTPLEALQAVSLGRAEAHIDNLAAASYLIDKHGLANLKIAAPAAYGNYDLHFGVRSDWPELASIINKVLGAITPEEHTAIRNGWLSVRYEYGISRGEVVEWVLMTVGAASILLIPLVLWSGRLKKENVERRKAEAALISANQQLNDIIEFLPDATFVIDKEGKVIAWNRAIEEMTGVSKKDMLGKGDHAFTVPFYGEKRKHLLDLIDVSDNILESKYQYIKRKGNTLCAETFVPLVHGGKGAYVFATGAPLFDVRGVRVGAIESIRDITDRKDAEEALRESEVRFRTISELASDYFYSSSVAPNGDITVDWIGGAFQTITGYDTGMMKNLDDWMSMVIPEDLQEIQRSVQILLSNRPAEAEYRIKTKSGEERWLRDRTRPVWDDKQQRIVTIFGAVRDITDRRRTEEERRRLEAKLQEARKTEAIATLAGGIAHEFNNALAAIFGNIDLIEMDRSHDYRFSNYFEPIKISTQRMARLTSQLLAYAGGGRYQPTEVSLSEFVGETLPIIKHSISSEIRIEMDLPHDVLNVEVDLTQMQMVLSALMSNAAEAMDGNGRIRVSTTNRLMDNDHAAQTNGLGAGPYVCLAVEDDGKGMDEKTKKRIFEPFFSTKYQGRGLGMAAAYGIVENHGGSISVHSIPGKGTKVEIWLPAIEAPSLEIDKPAEGFFKGTGTILVVEDEQVLMNLNRSMLELMGYRVLGAQTGQEALAITEEFEGDIDLVMLDIGLPDIPGGQVYESIMKVRPLTKVLIATGYAIEDSTHGILHARTHSFIQKPFSMASLSAKVKELLENEG